MSMIENIKLNRLRKKWRLNNKHNKTRIANLCNINQIKVGKGTYGPIYALTHGTDSRLSIGNYCSIGPQVAFVLQSDHPTNHFTTYPIKVMSGLVPYEASTKGDIIIEDDVWIGMRTIIMSGVHIGRGAVIAAGTIVTHDIPPYAIVAGTPGIIKKYRFDKDTIEILMKIDYSSIEIDLLSNIIEDLYQKINDKEDAIKVLNILQENGIKIKEEIEKEL